MRRDGLTMCLPLPLLLQKYKPLERRNFITLVSAFWKKFSHECWCIGLRHCWLKLATSLVCPSGHFWCKNKRNQPSKASAMLGPPKRKCRQTTKSFYQTIHDTMKARTTTGEDEQIPTKIHSVTCKIRPRLPLSETCTTEAAQQQLLRRERRSNKHQTTILHSGLDGWARPKVELAQHNIQHQIEKGCWDCRKHRCWHGKFPWTSHRSRRYWPHTSSS